MIQVVFDTGQSHDVIDRSPTCSMIQVSLITLDTGRFLYRSVACCDRSGLICFMIQVAFDTSQPLAESLLVMF